MPPARALLYAATLGVLAFVARAVLVAPPALPTTIGVCVLYTGIFLSGVFFIRLRMFTDAVVGGPPDARGVSLTFDDGPHPVHTRKVLEVLAAAGVKATFFVIGKKAEKAPEIVREILASGHTVGLHSYGHARLFAMKSPSSIKKDLVRGIAVLEEITGAKPALFRPPIGHTTPAIARVADELDLCVVGWSVSGIDGFAGAIPDLVEARVRAGLRHGAIVALHDAPERGEHEPAGVKALPHILKAIDALGLPVVPLEPWV